jgi:phage-related protein
VERITATFARVVIEFNCSSPYFRSTVASTDNTTTISATDTAMVVDNIGTVEERDPTITFAGPLKNIVISSTDSVSLTYTGTLASSDTVVIKTETTGEYSAILNGVTNVIGNVTHPGTSALLVLLPGTNNLSVTTETTGGTVKIEFYPPFL